MDTIQVDLVTPERQFASVAASLVEVPGTEGDFGVLPGHAPLISTIRPGVVMIQGASGKKDRFLVVGGVAEVTPERCTILAEHLESLEGMTREKAAIALEVANAKELSAVSEAGKREAIREKILAELRLQAVA